MDNSVKLFPSTFMWILEIELRLNKGSSLPTELSCCLFIFFETETLNSWFSYSILNGRIAGMSHHFFFPLWVALLSFFFHVKDLVKILSIWDLSLRFSMMPGKQNKIKHFLSLLKLEIFMKVVIVCFCFILFWNRISTVLL